MKRLLFIIWQWTWGFIQTFCGFVLFLINFKCKHYWYHNALVTVWDKNKGVSLGLFIFVWPDDQSCVVHEYGHSIQSLILGPLYFVVIGIPSAIWCNVLAGYRKRRRKNYYDFYPEKSANYLGSRATGERVL